ncbi:O-methyltransferase [Dermacoccus nishinomiyaensis]|uniref:Methyltransferase n=1 Tax=Dermacoccus nishinomiyaensis TaxID=1274 RepID=A0A075JEW4_9MICO|nr:MULTISPECIES: O-methyltransferase [Dermacoccus]HCQ19692.1 O-methyltransferase [Dermacoccus sp.]AIF40315.1 methyltransferase [Dermacoccus nishinomiyaensis]MBO1758695.1 O-methyltransferase [Dermacoccus sp. NHGro5]MCG7430306.1 O-methyltransferase [Dermacoccus nishinomiyaensis]MCI0154288.1 O-methyltransferase [Dermacoccus nishinomiyaensis]
MTSFKPASWAYAEDFADEPQHIEAARIQGEHLGATPVTSAAGAALRMLAASTAARTVVEIGTGAGSSGLWLLDGMPADGVLTTIDISMEHQRAARAAYQRAGYPPQRTRIISGSALTVLPRLADAAYDLVLVDGEKDEYPAYVEQALRLVRRGGVIVLDNMLWHDRVADPAVRDETTKRLRALGKELRERDDLLTTLLPVGDGLLVCVKR